MWLGSLLCAQSNILVYSAVPSGTLKVIGECLFIAYVYVYLFIDFRFRLEC